MSLVFTGMPSDSAAAYRAGAPDANGQPPERHVLARPEVAYVHMRSAANNCFTLRIDRARGQWSVQRQGPQ